MDNIQLIQDEYLNEPAIITEDFFITYGELKSLAMSISQSLSDMGIRSGERIGIISQNSVTYVLLIIALLDLEAISVPINIRWPEVQIRDALQDVGADHLIISREMQGLDLGYRKIFLEDLINKKRSFKKSTIDLDNEATIIFTSGSSGNPKGALHTIRNHYYSALGSNTNIAFGPGDVWGIFLPLYHVGGMSIVFRALVSGGAMAIPRKNCLSQNPFNGWELHIYPLCQHNFIECLRTWIR